MKSFPYPLRLELIGRRRWRLAGPLVFNDPVHGRIELTPGLVTDLATIRPVRSVAVLGFAVALLLQLTPWGLLSDLSALLGLAALAVYAAVAGYGHASSAIHDGLYLMAHLPRAECDAVYYRALRAEGAARWRARIMWLGPRLGGWRRYGRDRDSGAS